MTDKTATFRDAKGGEWAIRLDFAALHRIRDGANVDLGDVERLAQTWAEILYDDAKAMNVVWQAIAHAADAKGVDRAGFDAAMDGSSLEGALTALGEAVLSFTQPRKRGMAAKAIEMITEGMRKAMQQAEAEIENVCKKSTNEALAALGT